MKMGNCFTATIETSIKCANVKNICRKKVKIPVVLLVVGLDNAGKSAVVNYLFNKSVLTKESVVPTIGFRSVTFNYKSYSVRLYDIGGGPQIRALWPKYYSDVHGVIYVVDANDHERLSESADVFQELACHELITQKPILFLGNKQDLRGALDELDIIGHMNISGVVNFAKCFTKVEICSCYPDKNKHFNLNKNINKGFDWLLSVIRSNYSDLDKRVKKPIQNGTRDKSLKIKSWAAQSIANSFSYSDTDSETYLKPIVPDMTKYRMRKRRKKRKKLNNLFSLTKNRTAPLPENDMENSVPTTKSMKELIRSIKIEDLLSNAEIDGSFILNYQRQRRWTHKRPRTAPPVSSIFEVIQM